MRDDQLERTLYEKFRQFAKGRAQSALRYRTRQRSARGRGKEKKLCGVRCCESVAGHC
jgi:hypothetical protein